MCRTNLPVSKRVFITVGPEWAPTLTYFWDAELWAHAWAMLEPVTMKEQLAKWLAMDIHQCYALDYMSGKGAGPWYAANDWAVFRCVEAYLDVTGDQKFLQQTVSGKTVLEHLVRLATAYEQLSPKDGLANYGENGNLLECAPAYIHRIPSLNAANVYMLRRAADYLDAADQKARAADLRTRAEKVCAAVLALYSPGEGTWNALHLDGTRVPLRHCLDYIVIGQVAGERTFGKDEAGNERVRGERTPHPHVDASYESKRSRCRNLRSCRPRSDGQLRRLAADDDGRPMPVRQF